VFDVTEKEQATPFTYYTTSGTMMLMRIVEDVGVNFRHLMHLKSDITFHPGGRILEPDKTYTLKATLDDIVQLRDDRVTLITRAWIHDENDESLLTNRDFFIILNLAPKYIEELRSTPGFGRHDVSEFENLSKLQAMLTSQDVQRIPIKVPEDMGKRYGKVSGDMNLVHTTRIAARIFGFPKPFIQGLCTANYVLKHLTGVCQEPVLSLTATFTRRVYVGQTVYLSFDDQRFELCDKKGALLVLGEWETAGAGWAGVGPR
jgi:acyl dehydratase